MQRMSLHLRGPIHRPLWNRVRRRLVRTSSVGLVTTLIAGGALYLASAVEPNLSGIWVRDDGAQMRLFHVGTRVTSTYEKDGAISFDANFTSSSKLKGYIYWFWTSEEGRRACGRERFKDHTFEATVKPGYDALEYRWTRPYTDNLATCAVKSRKVAYGSLRRMTN